MPDGLSAIGCGRPTLADRLSARTGVRREESAGNVTLTISQPSGWQIFKSPSVGECVEQWELAAVGVDIVTTVVPSNLQNLVKLCVLYHPVFLLLDKP